MNSPWDKDWLEAQKRYMDALASFGAKVMPEDVSATTGSEWQKALDYWWQSSSGDMPEDAQAIFSNLLQHSKTWYSISEQFKELFESIACEEDSAKDWQSVLTAHIDKMKKQMKNSFADEDNPYWHSAVQSPLDGWHKMFNSMLPLQQTTNKQFADFQAMFEKISEMASTESNKELFENVQKGLQLWQDYQNNYQEYRQTLNCIGLNSLDKLKEKILLRAKKKKPLSSLRELYDLWIDSHEEAYSEFVLQEDYSRLYGQLINSMMAFKAHSHRFVSECSNAMNFSSADKQDALQKEINELKQQQQLDKKRIRLLEEKMNDPVDKSPATTRSNKTGKKKVDKKKVARKKRDSRSSRVNK